MAEKQKMMHYFALILLFTPISHARAIVANTTLFDIDLHGNAKKLAEMKTMAFKVAGNETVHSRSMRLLKELVPDQDAVRTNLTRAGHTILQTAELYRH